ncbi:hypothetical protein C7121_06360 [Paenibacillus glucanolyticus]|uniref:Transposase n=2 Tax=Paenibacillus TaxID=44249 RepID=A0A7Y6BS14_9BACL|nr:MULTISPECIES: DUF6262 family protein [Paenibacillus]AVV55789.1 hypothetical protein C7121_06360 [Paenibacillus glucanolyticus]MEC0373508.1 DUF6262 family protein [Paenibacillus chibensis]NUU73905.1 hypothetical protein [Paenibacillus xylanilyticus]
MSDPSKENKLVTLERIEQAITNLRKGKKKLSISAIAKKAGIERKTIYNRPDLKERCDQAILLQMEIEKGAEKIAATAIETSTRPSGKRLLENRYEKVKQALQNEKEKNEKLLEICRKHVIEKAQLKSRIEYLENKIQELRERQLKPFQ